MQRERSVSESLRLMKSFPPTAWREAAYVDRPPFVSEDIDGSSLVIPMSAESEGILDGIHPSLGLKKVNGNQPYYLTSRNDTIKALRTFNWFVRKSWRHKEFAVLWALFFETARHGDAAASRISARTLAALTGYDVKDCEEVLSGLLGTKAAKSARNSNGGDYEVRTEGVQRKLQDLLAETPTWTEEHIMNALCSEMGASAAELYNQMLPHDMTVGAVYKAAEELKRNGYIHTVKHFRVNDRGPMRELLSSDCGNCFYGYSNAESCFKDAFSQLERILERYYGKSLTEAQRSNSFGAMRSLPQGPRVVRKVIEALSLVHRMENLMKERQVTNVLRKMEEWYGISVPISAR